MSPRQRQHPCLLAAALAHLAPAGGGLGALALAAPTIANDRVLHLAYSGFDVDLLGDQPFQSRQVLVNRDLHGLQLVQQPRLLVLGKLRPFRQQAEVPFRVAQTLLLRDPHRSSPPRRSALP